MGPFYKLMRGIIFVGQLGFIIVTPPLVFIYLAYWLQKRFDIGVWVMILAILFGLLTSASSAINLFSKFLKNKNKNSDNSIANNKSHEE